MSSLTKYPSAKFDWANDEEDDWDFDTWKANHGSGTATPNLKDVGSLQAPFKSSFDWANDEEDDWDFETWKANHGSTESPKLEDLGPLQLPSNPVAGEEEFEVLRPQTTPDTAPSRATSCTDTESFTDTSVVAASTTQVDGAPQEEYTPGYYPDAEGNTYSLAQPLWRTAPVWDVCFDVPAYSEMSESEDGHPQPYCRTRYAANWLKCKFAAGRVKKGETLLFRGSRLREVETAEEEKEQQQQQEEEVELEEAPKKEAQEAVKPQDEASSESSESLRGSGVEDDDSHSEPGDSKTPPSSCSGDGEDEGDKVSAAAEVTTQDIYEDPKDSGTPLNRAMQHISPAEEDGRGKDEPSPAQSWTSYINDALQSPWCPSLTTTCAIATTAIVVGAFIARRK